MDKNMYEEDFKRLLNRTLISYPFFEKSDSELIIDSKRRTSDDIEFGLFKIVSEGANSYIIDNEVVNSRVLQLKSTLDNSKAQVEIKLSTFIYPSFFLCSLGDEKETMKSSLNYQTYFNYRELNREILNYIGKTVLVTSSWDLVSKFRKFVKCVNIILAPDDEQLLAKLIRQCFIRERKIVIQDIINNPSKYMSSYPVEYDILEEVFVDYKPKLEAELRRIDI
jgi:hypothetical protein